VAAVNPEFDDCLKRGRIRRFPGGTELAGQELDQAGEDLSTARGSRAAGNHKWATIQAYYAMFHTARALLYRAGYRERSHYCLQAAVREIYVSSRRLEARFLESLQLAKMLRENADYYGRFSADGAERLLGEAEAFIAAARGLITE
jgi:uncharacterized protein (UPF0332 family)